MDQKEKIKISFDFDSTLSEGHMQDLAILLIAAGVDVWVLTSRQDDKVRDERGVEIGHSGFNWDMYKIMKEVGIPKHKVIFTNGALKWDEYSRMGFKMHFDDMWDEVEEINKNGGKALLVGMRISEILHLISPAEMNKFKNTI